MPGFTSNTYKTLMRLKQVSQSRLPFYGPYYLTDGNDFCLERNLDSFRHANSTDKWIPPPNGTTLITSFWIFALRNALTHRGASHNPHGSGGGHIGGRIYWQHEAEHLSTLVTPASRPPPDPESSLKRLHQLADQKQLTITPVKLLLREQKGRRELLVTNIETGVSMKIWIVNWR